MRVHTSSTQSMGEEVMLSILNSGEKAFRYGFRIEAGEEEEEEERAQKQETEEKQKKHLAHGQRFFHGAYRAPGKN